jgi:precorrin-6B methylase 2
MSVAHSESSRAGRSGAFLDRAARWLRRQKALKGLVVGSRDLADQVIDRWLGIRTCSRESDFRNPAARFGDGIRYVPNSYLFLSALLRPLELSPEDVVVDVGCGMGRTLCAFARRNVRKCVGIECDPTLADIARANAARLRGRRAPIEVVTIDATEADYSEGTVFWFFDPFGAETMRRVLERIRASLEERPRRVRLVYVHPTLEAELERAGWLARTGEWNPRLFALHRASYWTDIPG